MNITDEDRDELTRTLIRASREVHGEFGACVDEVDAPLLVDAILASDVFARIMREARDHA